MNSVTRINAINERFERGSISKHEQIVSIHAIIGNGGVHGDYTRNGQRHWDIDFPNIGAAYDFLAGVINAEEMNAEGDLVPLNIFDGFIEGKERFSMNTVAVVTLTELSTERHPGFLAR